MSNSSSSHSSRKLPASYGSRRYPGHHGDDFGYQTRMVVYNFFGLVPSTPSGGNRGSESPQDVTIDGYSESLEEGHLNSLPKSWGDDLKSLPTENLIGRLGESEELLKLTNAVQEEIKAKVGTCEPSSNGDGTSRFETVFKDRQKSQPYGSVSPRYNDPRQRSRSPTEEEIHPITVIQKKNKVKLLTELSVRDGENLRKSLSPVPESVKVPSDRPLVKDPTKSQEKSAPYRRSQSSSVPSSKSHSTTSSSDGAVKIIYMDGDTSGDVSPSVPGQNGAQNGQQAGSVQPTQGSKKISGGRKHPNTSHSTRHHGQTDEEKHRGEYHVLPDSVQEEPGTGEDTRLKDEDSAAGDATFGRQTSSRSGGTSRRSTYVDIQDVDNVEQLVASRAIPPQSLELKRELSKYIMAVEEKFGADEILPYSDVPKDDIGGPAGELLFTPESEVADSLRVIGDRIQEVYGEQIDEIVRELVGNVLRPITYENISTTSSSLIQRTHHGWTRVALVMLVGQQLVFGMLRRGYSGVSDVAEHTARMIEENLAEFIINNGGWQSITELGVVETPIPIDSAHPLSLSQSESDSPQDHIDSASKIPTSMTSSPQGASRGRGEEDGSWPAGDDVVSARVGAVVVLSLVAMLGLYLIYRRSSRQSV